jgi:uncharacterized membrane protein YbaN (DUF454 family)
MQPSHFFTFNRFNPTHNLSPDRLFLRRAEMTMLTQFSIDPAGVGAGLAQLGCALVPSVSSAVEMSFILPVPLPRAREPESGPSIERASGATFLKIQDPRLFGPGRDAFCRALLESAVTQGAFRSAEIHLESATCRLEFDPSRLDRAEVAERAALAIRAATPALLRRGHDRWRVERDWTSLYAFAAADDSRPSIWETRTVGPGRLRLRNRGHCGHHVAVRSASLLRKWPGVCVSECLPTFWGHELDVEFDPQVVMPGEVVLAAEAALRVARQCAGGPSMTDSDQIAPSITNLPSGVSWDMLVGAGSMLFAALGVVLPGIPSVPFFVLSCHSLGRACPQLRPWLHSIPGVGQLLRASTADDSKWTDSNFVAKTVILGALVAAFFLIVHPPLPLVLACELGMVFLSIH